MKIPVVEGLIKRRILLNYRVDKRVISKVLPKPFAPKLVKGYAMAGICLIRLEQIRPRGLPSWFAMTSENSAHRVAVEWRDKSGLIQEGVFVSRRDTNSLLNHLAGGRIFPGVHHYSDFRVSDKEGKIALAMMPKDAKQPSIEVEALESELFPSDSIFDCLEESSLYFERGCTGYSSRPNSCVMDGLELAVSNWKVIPLKIEKLHSAYFDDVALFPKGSIEFDHALLMRDIPHEWHSLPLMRSGE